MRAASSALLVAVLALVLAGQPASAAVPSSAQVIERSANEAFHEAAVAAANAEEHVLLNSAHAQEQEHEHKSLLSLHSQAEHQGDAMTETEALQQAQAMVDAEAKAEAEADVETESETEMETETESPAPSSPAAVPTPVQLNPIERLKARAAAPVVEAQVVPVVVQAVPDVVPAAVSVAPTPAAVAEAIPVRSFAATQATSRVTAAVTAGASDDTKSITLSYYVFGLIAFGSCVFGSILSFVLVKLFTGQSKSEYD